MTNRKISQALRTVPPVVWVLITLAAVVAAGTFAQSAHGLVGFGTDRMRLPVGFALLNPVCVDVLSVSAMVAAYVLRRAPWHVRVYGWLIFWLTLVLSVAGNEAQAYARLLPDDGRFGPAPRTGAGPATVSPTRAGTTRPAGWSSAGKVSTRSPGTWT
jgi:hypothetical protein